MKSLDHINIDSENSFYQIFSNADGYITKESNGYKYLVFASTNQNKKSIRNVHKTLK